MNDKVKEMAKIISSDTCDKDCSNRCAFCGANAEKEAKNLYNEGYRKESDTAREIFDKIFEVLCCFTTQGKSKEYNEGYIDCLSEVDKRLQNLAKEKYGVDLGE